MLFSYRQSSISLENSMSRWWQGSSVSKQKQNIAMQVFSSFVAKAETVFAELCKIIAFAEKSTA